MAELNGPVGTRPMPKKMFLTMKSRFRACMTARRTSTLSNGASRWLSTISPMGPNISQPLVVYCTPGRARRRLMSTLSTSSP
ncbi:Uncharacterised protein [Bordetella pertussis]|nr:Uncharacterised protein [Bordetella pertussis]CFW46724.1 Uncharacterised protein [Bordetella pertussis]CPK76565.1 Uncharacterised protein [Bordetella pertussis]CPM51801.1 Uncharacterised protein [Bordetella pertussis]